MIWVMLPIKTKSVFKSRWIALLWAGGIVWSAAQYVGDQPHGASAADNQGNADTSSDTAEMQAAAKALAAMK